MIVLTVLYLPFFFVARYTTYPVAPLTFFHVTVAVFLEEFLTFRPVTAANFTVVVVCVAVGFWTVAAGF